jgi:hypothetical protein
VSIKNSHRILTFGVKKTFVSVCIYEIIQTSKKLAVIELKFFLLPFEQGLLILRVSVMGQASVKALAVDAVIFTSESQVKVEEKFENKNVNLSENKVETFVFRKERFARMKKCLRKRSNSIL